MYDRYGRPEVKSGMVLTVSGDGATAEASPPRGSPR
jgi:hypothetical protein